VEPHPLGEYRLRFDLEVYAVEGDSGLELWWLYNESLFDEWRISQMAQHYITILENAVSSPDVPLHRLPMMSSAEVDAIVQFNVAG
jgi:non-ribosomal peptide synthetase component F